MNFQDALAQRRTIAAERKGRFASLITTIMVPVEVEIRLVGDEGKIEADAHMYGYTLGGSGEIRGTLVDISTFASDTPAAIKQFDASDKEWEVQEWEVQRGKRAPLARTR